MYGIELEVPIDYLNERWAVGLAVTGVWGLALDIMCKYRPKSK